MTFNQSYRVIKKEKNEMVDSRFVECLINFLVSSKNMTHFFFHHSHFIENEKTTVPVSSKN